MEPGGASNEDYCKWCYADGAFVYESKDALLDFLASHMPNPDNLPDEECAGCLKDSFPC